MIVARNDLINLLGEISWVEGFLSDQLCVEPAYKKVTAAREILLKILEGEG